MSLVYPLIEPQIALRACTGHFFGYTDDYVALLYSNRIVFRQVDLAVNPPLICGEDVVISIPQPPMTMGSSDDEFPNIGGVFFSVGRNKDMLAIQFKSSLLILSINSVEQKLELQGCWGLSKQKDASHKSSSQKNNTQKIGKNSSSVSLASLAADPSLGAPQRPPLRSHNSGSFTKQSHSPNHSPNHTPNLLHSQPHLPHSLGKLNLNNISGAMSSVQGSNSAGNSEYLAGRSGMCLCPDLPRPKPSPDGTQIFVVAKSKQEYINLLIISCFGKEVMKLETDYLGVLTLGWISDEMVYIVYLNGKFHKKFQVFRLVHSLKTSNIFGLGRKSVKPSFVPDTNVPIAVDFQPSTSDICGSPDLVFKDYVLLGTRTGGYFRVNYRSASWEPVLNAKSVLGAVSIGEVSLVFQCAAYQKSGKCPQEVNQITYSVVSESTVHAIKADPLVGACLCSKHNIDSDRRFTLKLLHLGDGYILDFKREPFHVFKYTSASKSQVPLRLVLPSNQTGNDPPLGLPLKPSKTTIDFLVKTEQALYTRDPNGDDNLVRKIVDSSTVLDVQLDRSKLKTFVSRDFKSLWGAFEDPAEIRIIEESSTKATKLKNRASFVFHGEFASWKVKNVHHLYRNVILVNLTSHAGTEGDDGKWAMFLLSFVGATSKSAHVPPKAQLLMRSEAPELPQKPLPTAGKPGKVVLNTFNTVKKTIVKSQQLSVTSVGEHHLENIVGGLYPVSLDQSDSITFFTDVNGPLDGVFLLGSSSPSDHVLRNVSMVDSLMGHGSRAIVLAGSEVKKSRLWVFDANGFQFQEFAAGEGHPEKTSKIFGHYEQLLKYHQKQQGNQIYEISPEFSKNHFFEVTASNRLRPLPELPAVLCRGIGSGVDAEVYLKTADNGFFAIFRIQNKKLREALSRLERVVLEKQVGSWLPEELRSFWLQEFDGSTMVSSAFASFWNLSDEEQLELCKDASVDLELMRKVRPM